jgi:hypothetical protein
LFFQYVLKGINGINATQAEQMLKRTGIICNWWRTARTRSFSVEDIAAKLTPTNLDRHLRRYNELDPVTAEPFSNQTPFISTTAGTVEADVRRRKNYLRPAFWTAASFATDGFANSGFIFFGYVFTLGKPALELREFAEEPRDLHIYHDYLEYRDEGEIVAKVHIPSVRLQRCEGYRGPDLHDELRNGIWPPSCHEISNDGPDGSYRPPERFSNVRGVL